MCVCMYKLQPALQDFPFLLLADLLKRQKESSLEGFAETQVASILSDLIESFRISAIFS